MREIRGPRRAAARRRGWLAVTAAIVVALTASTFTSAQSQTPELKAYVGKMSLDIGVTTFSTHENPIRVLARGRYRFVVFDRSNEMNFHVYGPGLNRSTTAEFVGRQFWIVTFKPGTYVFRCDTCDYARVSGSFRVE